MRLIELYDTRTKTLRPLTPLNEQEVRIYSCGPTLYQPAHIGNMRAYIFADTLNRTLRHFGHNPKHIINFTDVGHLTDDADAGEDKIEKQAQEEKQSAEAITKKFGNLFLADLREINIHTEHYRFPRATHHIEEQIALVKALERKGYTYTIEDGVYFDTQTYQGYGALGASESAEDSAHARIQKVPGKKHPQDFALWKRTPKGVIRQQEWDSPWGRGFPGWHIECSAMAMKLLGRSIDIHTGGMDHITVHHNNEIAQSEGVTEAVFANIWMHVAFLTMSGEKLSKSLNNTYTVNDIKEREYDPIAIRYLFLLTSYRTPLSFSFEALESAQTALHRLQKDYLALSSPLLSRLNASRDETYSRSIDNAIANDLNTARVIALMWDILRDNTLSQTVKRKTLRYADTILGILPKEKFFVRQDKTPKKVQELLEKRDAARKNGDYDTADSLRKEIQALGYFVSDAKESSSVEKRFQQNTKN